MPKYRLRNHTSEHPIGLHVDNVWEEGPDGKLTIKKDPKGRLLEAVYSPGDVLFSYAPLERFPEKFERVPDNTPITIKEGSVPAGNLPVFGLDTSSRPVGTESQHEASHISSVASEPHSQSPITPAPTNKGWTDTLDAMNVKELEAFAAEEEVDLKGAKSKDAILKVLRSAQPAMVGAK